MSSNKGGFDRFVHKKESGAKLKEKIRQEKKQAREEKNAFFEQKKRERAALKTQDPAAPKKVFESKKSAQFRENTDDRTSFGRKQTGRSFKKDDQHSTEHTYKTGKETRSYNKKSNTSRSSFKDNNRDESFKKDRSERPYKSGRQGTGRSFSGEKTERSSGKGKERFDRGDSYKKEGKRFEKSYDDRKKEIRGKDYDSKSKDSLVEAPNFKAKPINEPIPLNKFLAHAGVSSRRDAADIVKEGKVQVNGEVILEPGFKVTEKDEIKFNGKKLFARKNLVYILLNKPKDYITTTDDPQGRKTVLDIVKNATTERIYPIGRLDRNTTGVLLLTNDGELAQKLSHPSYEVKKIYEVRLDKPLTKADFDKLIGGVTLEDGFIAPDALGYPDPKDKSVIGIEIHSGKNRIVRRIFEHLGYDVRNLDRVMYADLTKKNVDRGKWRFLNEKEVRLLKFLNKSYSKNKSTRG